MTNHFNKNHLDGYDQTDLLLGKEPSIPAGAVLFRRAQAGGPADRRLQPPFFRQPYGWPGEKVTTDMPTIVNIRQDPFERTPSLRGESLNDQGGGYMNDFFAREFWRFIRVQQAVADLAKTAIEFPPMQAPASFNLEAVKAQVDEMIRQHQGQ